MDTLFAKPGRKLKNILLFTLLFLLLTHGYRYFQTAFNYDSLAFASDGDISWKLSLGRFMQPVYWLLRGKIAAPFVVGIFSYIWLVLSAYVLSDILRLRSDMGLFLLSGVLTGSLILVETNATFIHESDTFLLAQLLVLLAVKCCLSRKPLQLAGSVLLLICATGLYQAYAQTFVAVIMIWAVRELLTGESGVKKVWLQCLRGAVVLILGIGLYLLVNKGVQQTLGIIPWDGDNGMTGIGDYTGISPLYLAFMTWCYPVYYYIRIMAVRVNLTFTILHTLVLLYAGIMTILVLIKKKAGKLVWISALGILFLLPAGMNCMYLISKRILHDLYCCAYVAPELYAIAITEYALKLLPEEPKRICPRFFFRRALPVIMCLMFLSKAVWANQQYLKKDLEDDATKAVVIRVLDRMEQLDGYEPGVTPVHFVGRLAESPLMKERPNFESLSNLFGSECPAALIFKDDFWTFWSYFEDVLGYPIVPYDGTMTPAQEELASSMQPFPAADSVQLTDGLVLIRLS